MKKMSINLDIVFVAARRAETALAAERNEFKISAMRTGIHGAAVRRVTTMNVYAHSTRKAKRESAKLLDKVVGND